MEQPYQDLEGQTVTYAEPESRRQSQIGLQMDASKGRNTNFRRQKSLVRPERERVDRSHPQYFYRNATQNLDGSHVRVQPSTTGTAPNGGVQPARSGVRRGKSVLGREIEKPGHMRAKTKPSGAKRKIPAELNDPLKKKGREWPSKWVIYYNAITCCFPAAILKSCGMHTLEIQRAWREKIALVSLIVMMVLAVGFLTFGLQQALCQDEQSGKFVAGSRPENVIVDGMGYYFNAQDSGNGELVWMHPALNKEISSEPVDIMNAPGNAAKGMDASFLFQDTAGHAACDELITRNTPAAPMPGAPTETLPEFYFPCVMRSIDGITPPDIVEKNPAACHIPSTARTFWNNLKSQKMTKIGACLKQIARVGAMDSKTIGCVTSDVITYVSLVIILGVVFIKFFLAVFFGWFLSHRLGGFGNESYQDRMK
ncbi:Chitin synthase, class 3, partial [Modicella reniformis]